MTRSYAVLAVDDVAAKYHEAFKDLFPSFPSKPGEVEKGPPALGTFVFPDNERQGVVEHLLLECGEVAYPDLLPRARAYVDMFESDDRRRANWAPYDQQKAEVAAVVSLLKPGKTNTASIADNEWVGKQTRHIPVLAALLAFAGSLLDSSS